MPNQCLVNWARSRCSRALCAATLGRVDKCSFCGISEALAGSLMRGPDVMICRECGELAIESLTPREARPPGPTHLVQFSGGSEAHGVAPTGAMTPREVIAAIFDDDVEAILRAATPGFREHMSAAEMRRVLQSVPFVHERPDVMGSTMVLHDIGFQLDAGTVHVQIAYDGEFIAGLVVRLGAPTGRFGE